MKNLATNNQGVVVGLVIMIASTIAVAMMWIVTMPAVGLIWDAISPGLPTRAMPIMDMMNNVCGWTLLALIIGCIAYGAALSFRRDPVDVQG
jgi:hypothetical protein